MIAQLIAPEPLTKENINGRGRRALERLRARMDSLTASELRALNFDLRGAITRALIAAPTVKSMRERIAHECPGANLAVIDELEDRALAAAAASADYESALAPPEGLDAVVNELVDSRTVLLAGANFLISCNELPAQTVAAVRGGRGYHEVAQDAMTLVAAYGNRWSQLEGKLPITRAQLDRVQGLAERLMLLIGYRDALPQRAAATSDARVRAFTLLEQSYSEVRRAVVFLRWHQEDADELVPPLRAKSGSRRNSDKGDVTDTTHGGGNGNGTGTGNGTGNRDANGSGSGSSNGSSNGNGADDRDAPQPVAPSPVSSPAGRATPQPGPARPMAPERPMASPVARVGFPNTPPFTDG